MEALTSHFILSLCPDSQWMTVSTSLLVTSVLSFGTSETLAPGFQHPPVDWSPGSRLAFHVLCALCTNSSRQCLQDCLRTLSHSLPGGFASWLWGCQSQNYSFTQVFMSDLSKLLSLFLGPRRNSEPLKHNLTLIHRCGLMFYFHLPKFSLAIKSHAVLWKAIVSSLSGSLKILKPYFPHPIPLNGEASFSLNHPSCRHQVVYCVLIFQCRFRVLLYLNLYCIFYFYILLQILFGFPLKKQKFCFYLLE